MGCLSQPVRSEWRKGSPLTSKGENAVIFQLIFNHGEVAFLVHDPREITVQAYLTVSVDLSINGVTAVL